MDGAFPRELAEEGRAILWRETGCDPNDPSTWTQPVIRLGQYGETPFKEAANKPTLHSAFDRLVGKGKWRPRPTLGYWPIRFPVPGDPGDDGWHVDAAFPAEDSVRGDFSTHRLNIVSKGRAILMLFLFSDVSENDAPTRIRMGSHLDIARVLEPAGEAGMSSPPLDSTTGRPLALATGEAGTVYLCHPFLVHAAQRHKGSEPRFLAQPPLNRPEPFSLRRDDGDYCAVEQAIRMGLGMPEDGC